MFWANIGLGEGLREGFYFICIKGITFPHTWGAWVAGGGGEYFFGVGGVLFWARGGGVKSPVGFFAACGGREEGGVATLWGIFLAKTCILTRL